MAKKTYRVGVIGRTGRGDYGHAVDRAFARVPAGQVVAVADDNPQGLAAAAQRHQVDAAFADYREMLEKVRPDIVLLCPRWIDQHAEMALAAIEYGCHLYMEKPLCQTLEEADALVAACERTHAKVALALPTAFSPKLATVKQLLDAGEIGEVLEYRARGKEDRRGGGEDLWVLGTHLLDLIRTFAGQPTWCFAQVTADGRPVTAADVVDGPEGLGPLAGNGVQAMFGLPGGTATAYFASLQERRGKPAAFSRYGIQIFGTTGALEIIEGPMPEVKILRDASWSPGRNRTQWQDVSSAGIGKPEPLTDPIYADRHAMAVTDLIAAIEENRAPQNDMVAGRDVVEMIMSVFESQRQRCPVALPLVNRKHPLTLLS